MDDATAACLARQVRELDDLCEGLERSREKIGVEADELKAVTSTALDRVGVALDRCRDGAIGDAVLYRLDPVDPAFAGAG